MTDDLHQAYSDNESCITALCEDQARARATAAFTVNSWHTVSCIGGLMVALGMFFSLYLAWGLVLFVIPWLEIRRANERMESRVRGISIQLDRRFAMRAYLRSQIRGY